MPENMQPANNDSGFSSDDEDDIATQGPLAPRMREKDWAISSKLTGMHTNTQFHLKETVEHGLSDIDKHLAWLKPLARQIETGLPCRLRSFEKC